MSLGSVYDIRRDSYFYLLRTCLKSQTITSELKKMWKYSYHIKISLNNKIAEFFLYNFHLIICILELKASLRKLEHENADLKFLNNQYVQKARQLEKESREKSDRILHLQEKNFHAVVQTPGKTFKSRMIASTGDTWKKQNPCEV